MKRNRRLFRLVMFCLSVLFIVGFSSINDKCFAKQVYSMAAFSMGGGVYRFMAALSKILNEEMSDAQFTVLTGDAPGNVLLIESREVALAVSGGLWYLQVRPDDLKFEKTTVRTIWPIMSFCSHLIVPENSPVQSYDDLKGKKIAVGLKTAEGGDFLKMCKAMGWTDKDTKNFFYVGKGEGIDAYKDGTVDAWYGMSTVPSPDVMVFAASRRGAKVIGFTDAQMEKVLKVRSDMTRGFIPAGSHEKIKKDVQTGYIWTLLVARDDFPEDIAYKIAKICDKRMNEVVAVFDAARDAKAENVQKSSVFKIHPGVVRFLKEKGLM